ncbi:MAG: amidohydrolase family protein, partial [Alkalimonas sp.]|nr:amidohydrolase family protein [Alkalimonas sp.]
MKLTLVALTALLISGSLHAAADRLILAGQLLDVRSGELRSQQAILIKHQRIERIVPISQLQDHERPADVLDLSDYTVLPGLIDMHVHLTSNPQKHGYRRLNDTPTRQALFGVTAARATLDAGFTTVRNVGARGFADVDLRDA